MSDEGGWLELLGALAGGHVDEAAFHDRFLDRWRRARDAHEPLPAPIEDLFYVVEAICPDPALRDPGSPYEADEAELRSSAELAKARLERDRLPGKLT